MGLRRESRWAVTSGQCSYECGAGTMCRQIYFVLKLVRTKHVVRATVALELVMSV
jgi:hypothetical protein